MISINSFAAVVSDNDGSAFITKAEFDSLKSNFQSQIDQYNSSIDSKIDGAIASYLSGMSLSKEEKLSFYIRNIEGKKINNTSKYEPIEYSFGSPIIYGEFTRYDDAGNSAGGYNHVNYCLIAQKTPEEKNKQSKTYITNMDDVKKIAAWKGYYKNVIDYLNFMWIGYYPDKHWGNQNTPDYYSEIAYAVSSSNKNWNSWNDRTTSLIGQFLGCFDEIHISNNTTMAEGMQYQAIVRSILHEIPEQDGLPYVTCFADYYYDLFSNWDDDRQWSYKPMNTENPYVKKFADKYTVGDINPARSRGHLSNFADCVGAITNSKSLMSGGTQGWAIWNKSENPIPSPDTFSRSESEQAKNSPLMIGFEAIDAWSKIYQSEFDAVLNAEGSSNWSSINTVLTDKNGTKHISLAAGVPLFELKKNSSFTYSINFEDISKDYIIWLNDKPFTKDSPHLESSTLKVDTLDEVTTWYDSSRPNNHAYKVKRGNGIIKISNLPNDGILFIKWTEDTSDITKAGGGVLLCQGSAVRVVSE